MFDELEAFLGALPGQQARLLELGPDDVMVGPVDVAAECRVDRELAEARPGLTQGNRRPGHLGGRDRVAAPGQAGPLKQLDEEARLVRRRHGEAAAEIGQALADQAFGRVDQEDAGLEAVILPNEPGLLQGVLQMMARIGLVGEDTDQLGRPDWQVRVQVDPRTQIAVVPVVAGPWLPLHEADPEPFSIRQPECRPGTFPKRRHEPVDHGTEPVGRDHHRSVPVRQALDGGARAGQRPPDLGSSHRKELGRPPFGRPVEAALDVVKVGRTGETGRCRVEGASVRLDRRQLCDQPGPPQWLDHVGGHPITQQVSIRGEGGRRAQGLEIDPRLELGWSEVGIDEAGQALVKAEGEQEIVGGDRVGRRHP